MLSGETGKEHENPQDFNGHVKRMFTKLGVELEFPVAAHIVSEVVSPFGGHALCVPRKRSANGRNVLSCT